MTDLPYTLTEGLQATQNGLEITNPIVAAVFLNYEVQQYRSDLGGWKYIYGNLFSVVVNNMPFHILVPEENCIYEADKIGVSWSEIAKILYYQKGESWCHLDINRITFQGQIVCAPKSAERDPNGELAMHRLVSIIVDDPDAFRVLHRYISEFNIERDHYDHGERLQRNMSSWKQREIEKHDKRMEADNE